MSLIADKLKRVVISRCWSHLKRDCNYIYFIRPTAPAYVVADIKTILKGEIEDEFTSWEE